MKIEHRSKKSPPRGAIRAIVALAAVALVVGVAPRADESGAAGGAPSGPATAAASPAPVPAYRQANGVAVLRVKGPIDFVTLQSLERRIKRAVADGNTAVVLELDTPGGRLDATLDICNLLKDPSITPTNTVAWIHPQAYSAGTIMALACREIVVAPNATFGDAAPIQGIPVIGLVQMAPTERAKIEAPILAEVVDSARRNHYDENLVQSFVSVGIELWLIENVDTGERVFVDRTEYRTAFGEDPPQQITAVAPPTAPDAPAVLPRINTLIPRPGPGEGDLLTPEQISEQIEFQQQLPPLRGPLTERDRGRWRLLTQVVTDDRLLTVKRAEALYFGLAADTVANDDQLKAFFGAQTLTRYDRSWSEVLVRLLVSTPVRIVLIIVFLVGLFLELAAPGFGVFGTTAVAALLVLIGAPFLAGLAQWWDVAFIAVGIVLIGMEIFVIPGFGVAGIVGALCLLIGLVGTFVSSDLTSPQGQQELGTGIVSILTALFAAGVGVWLLSRQVHSIPVLNRLMLHAELAHPDRPSAAGGTLLRAMAAPRPALQVGDLGVAETDLRPAGHGRFGDRLVDVQSPGSFVEQGSPIRVTSVGRYVVEVEEADS